MYVRPSYTLSALVILSACGGASTGGQTITPPTAVPFSENLSFERDAPTVTEPSVDTRVISNSVNDILTVIDTGRSLDDFTAYSGNGILYLEATDGTDDARVGVSALVDRNRADSRFGPGSFVDRSAGSLPVEGRPTYTGSYAGFLTTNLSVPVSGRPRNFTQSYISGDVELFADFNDSSVRGSITNRERFLTSDGTQVVGLKPVDILSTPLNGNGTGLGEGVGGGLDQAGYTPANGGRLDGFIGFAAIGDEAAGIAGTVRIEHNYISNNTTKGDDYTEIGAFVTTQ